jgi:FeS assembly SUF system protein
MSEPSQPQRRSLSVLGSADAKLAELRAAPAPAPGDTADAALVSHVNRLERQGRQPSALEAKIIEALRSVYDPEIPVNIYDLGLIYDIRIDENNAVTLRMTLTAPGCPVAGILPLQIESRVADIDEVRSATVELVWDPPWTKEMMSELARLELGL